MKKTQKKRIKYKTNNKLNLCFASFTQTRGDSCDLTLWSDRGKLHRPVPTCSGDHVGHGWGQPDAWAAHFIHLRPGRRHDDRDEHAALPIGAP